MLDNAGIGADYPDLWRPETASVVVSATGAGSGVLVEPGTISAGAGESVTFTGDESLSCDDGKNGRLKVSVGSGTTCGDLVVLQERILKEPYGVNDPAVFGPFVMDQKYCIDLKDSGCSDDAFGSIDYP